MAGRTAILSDAQQAFENGVGDPNLASIFMGARGSGKTALLMQLSAESQKCGWISVNVTCIPGMLEDIYEQTLRAAEQFTDNAQHPKLTGVSIAQLVSVSWEPARQVSGNWRTRMNAILDQLAQLNIGLLITVDEVQVDLDEMIQLAATYQHFIGEMRCVGLFMAGLPGNISSLLRDKSVSFLRRASLHRLGRISDVDIYEAIKRTITEGGRDISPDALQILVEKTEGFPYLMQLMGYRTWSQSDAPVITKEDAQVGVMLAQKDFTERVLDATYYELSQGDINFLRAMSEDTDISKTADIAARLGVSSNYVSTYKRRLIEQGIIGERGRSSVAFELPGFKAYLASKE